MSAHALQNPTEGVCLLCRTSLLSPCNTGGRLEGKGHQCGRASEGLIISSSLEERLEAGKQLGTVLKTTEVDGKKG